jgi:hypothetical protein
MKEQLSATKKRVLQKIARNLSIKEIASLESVLVKMMKNMGEELLSS